MLKKLALSSAAVLITLLLVSRWVVALPSRVTIINRSAHSLRNVVVAAGSKEISLNTIGSGETRAVAVPGGSMLFLEFRGEHTRRWMSAKPIVPGQSLVIYITEEEKIELNGSR